MSGHKNLVFSGMQPTNTLHLGNYLGALKNWVKMQDEMPCIYCVVDMHAITQDVAYRNPGELAAATREVTAAYIAAGVDPKRSVLFNQSQVHEHAELAWIFNCVARLGWLDRMTQFKEKTGKHKERASVGLYTYPILMAADILAYRATHVPVGDDQLQHLELARDIAQKFNSDFASPDYFPLPEGVVPAASARIMSLRDGTKKMSKSDESDYSRINLTDDADAIAQKIRKAKTDPHPLPENTEGLAGRPEAQNLVAIYASLSEETPETVVRRFAGQSFSSFKNALAELAVEKLTPIAAEMRRLLHDPAEIDRILSHGAQKARAIAAPIIHDVKSRMGFVV
ncbi:MAG TPA: tryptophan--tRNA ligase [Rhizomicrobium sp.]|nr:tryptophan--tRNA ligase [Rhizomicrobium sp.]